MSKRSFLSELKRRHVIRAAGLYLVGAWLITQVAGTVLPMFGAPGWVAQSVVALLAIGFIPALAVAWAFELTSAGLEHDAALVPSRASQDIDRKSIAVLPFENLCEDKANAYFVEGITDEILTRLAKISALKVCSRTSTRQYLAKPGNLAEIARQLGVANILEGSVQRSAGMMRVNVQLIEADSDSHLWAESYDGDVEDIFSVESEVAQAVADALKAALLPAEAARIANVPTTDPEAYDNYLKAQHLTRQIVSTSAKDPADMVRRAACLYENAIAADPEFALAYAQLAHLKAYAYWNDIDFSSQAINDAQIAAVQALALQPNLPEAHLAMGYVRYWGRRDYAGALTEFSTARASLPNDANVIAAIAFVHRRQGNLLQAIAELEQAVALDPHDSSLPRDLGDTLLYLRRYDEAVQAFEQSLALTPDNIETHIYRASAMKMRGDLEGSRRALEAIPAEYDPQGSVSLARFELALAMRDPATALASIAQAPIWLLDNVNNVLVPANLLRGRALARNGAAASARSALLEARRELEGQLRDSPEHPGVHANLAIVHAELGQTDAALAAARRATDLLPISKDMLDGSFYLAWRAKVEVQLGETATALEHLERLLAVPAGHEVSVASLRNDPAWDPLRDDPRLRNLLAHADTGASRAVTANGGLLSMLAELERRNVIRMAGLYLVGACLVVQVGATLLPVFAAPPWVLKALLATLAIGLLPTLVFSWAFELTPDGLRRDASVAPHASIARLTARRLNRTIIAVMLVALAYFGIDKFALAPQRAAALEAVLQQATEEPAITRGAAKDAVAIPARSIAVLPLANSSGDKDQLYFSDGLSEDLITVLSQFDGLKVISRNSAFQFRDSKEDARGIGAKLGVAHLLEGSVRRVGDTVRITAQLVDTTDGRTLWSQRYDRPFKDLFALQDEIVQAVAAALETRLLAGADAVVRSDRPPSGNLEAYGAYLEGNSYVGRGTAADLRKAIDVYARATRLDPGYAQAWARLSNAWTSLAARFLDGADIAQGHASARDAVDMALSIDAGLASAHLARGKLLLFSSFDWAGGETEYRRALELAPNDSAVKAALAEVVATLGHPDQAVELIHQALATDALNVGHHHALAMYLMPLGHLDEAEQALQRAIQLQPGAMGNREQLAIIEILRGNPTAAERFARQESPGDWQDAALARALQIGADRSAADAALRTLVDRQADKAAYQIAQVHALRDDPDQAFEWLDRAWDNRDAGISLLLYDPILLRYRADPRFAALARKVGLPLPGAPASAVPARKPDPLP